MYSVTVPMICDQIYPYKEAVLKELKRSGVTRVAITLYRELENGGSSQETLDNLKEIISFFEENGYETMVWIGETIGHDRRNKPTIDYGFTNIHTMERGVVAGICPMDESFSDMIANWAKKVANAGAKAILLDDDFRMSAGFGCCCELHMKRFEELVGEHVPPEELKAKLYGKGNKYRNAYIEAQGDGLRALARKIRAAVDTVDKNIRIGHCVTWSIWDTDGTDPIEISKILAGDNKPFIRTAGAPYHLIDSKRERFFGNIVEKTRAQIKWCEGQGIEIVTEGDTYPRPRFACPASYLECFDTMLRADGTADGILKYMFDYVSTPEYEKAYVDFAEKNTETYKHISRIFDGKKCVGVRPYLTMHTLREAELGRDGEDTIYDIDSYPFGRSAAYTLVSANSLPSSFEDDCVNIVFGENGKHIPFDMLKNGTIIDLTAAEYLMERGIDVGLEKIIRNESKIADGFFDLPTEFYIDEAENVRLDYATFDSVEIKKNATVLTKLKHGGRCTDFVFEYENADGQRFLVFPFAAKNFTYLHGYFASYCRRRMLVKSIEWLGRRPLDAYVVGNFPSLYIMTKRDESSLAIGLWNCYPDRADGIRIRISHAVKDIEFVNCNGHVEGDEIVLDTTVYPYEAAFINVTV